MDEAPCGCRFGNTEDTFWFEPCSLDCGLYEYVQEETAKQNKDIVTLDLRNPYE